MSGKKDIVYKSSQHMDRGELATFLRDLASKVESGQVTLTSSDQNTIVEIPSEVELELEYEIKQKTAGATRQLELEISWGEGGSGVGIA